MFFATAHSAGLRLLTFSHQSQPSFVQRHRGNCHCLERHQHNRHGARQYCKWVPSGYIETYNYDAVGNLTGKTDRKNQSITYTYDQLNRLTQKSYPDTSTVNYTYDLDSRLTQVTDPTGTYQFTFDTTDKDHTTELTLYDKKGNPKPPTPKPNE